MLIKLQRTRYSDEYFIIENACHVTYRDKPLKYYTLNELVDGMRDFLNGADRLLYPLQNSCWYQTDAPDLLHADYELDFKSGYDINEVSFTNNKGERESIRFDGEAFICNDEGKTIQKIKKGGCPSVFRPVPMVTAHIPV